MVLKSTWWTTSSWFYSPCRHYKAQSKRVCLWLHLAGKGFGSSFQRPLVNHWTIKIRLICVGKRLLHPSVLRRTLPGTDCVMASRRTLWINNKTKQSQVKHKIWKSNRVTILGMYQCRIFILHVLPHAEKLFRKAHQKSRMNSTWWFLFQDKNHLSHVWNSLFGFWPFPSCLHFLKTLLPFCNFSFITLDFFLDGSKPWGSKS